MRRHAAANGDLHALGNGCPETSAHLDQPLGIAIDACNNIYTADASYFDGEVRIVYQRGSALAAALVAANPAKTVTPTAGHVYNFGSLVGTTGATPLTTPGAFCSEATGPETHSRVRVVYSGGETLPLYLGSGSFSTGRDAGHVQFRSIDKPRWEEWKGRYSMTLASARKYQPKTPYFFVKLLAALWFLLPCCAAYSQDNSIASTPPMGWNSWNHFYGHVTDADIRHAADAMVSSGMRDAGYVYINIDDTWEGQRDAKGNIQGNDRFPDMKALADYVHARGLKLGIYSSPGPLTCAKFEGSYGHEEQDAKSYAAWGIDFLKYDLCAFRYIIRAYTGDEETKARAMQQAGYMKMHDALVATGRPIVFSLCQYGMYDVWKWGAEVGGNMWRTTGDIGDNYKSMSDIGFQQTAYAKYAGKGHWNDPDMLEIGNGGMTDDEYRTHMTLWAMLAAPLLAGNDLSKMTPETKAILTNAEAIAVDQDALGQQGERVFKDGLTEVYARPLVHSSKAIAIFNRSDEDQLISVDLTKLGVDRKAVLRDLWAHKVSGVKDGMFSQTIPKHGSVLLKVE